MRVQCPIPSKLAFFISEQARFKAAHGGRGSAKSWGVARAAIVRAMQKNEQILFTRQYQKSIKDSSYQLLKNQINTLGVSKYFDILGTEIRCKLNGSRFTFLGLQHEPEKIKSLEGITICVVEEANSINSTSLDILLPTIRAENSEIWAIWNRKSKDDPIDKMLIGEGRDNAIVVEINYDDNPWFPDVLREEMEWDKAHDYDKYLHVWKGQPLTNTEARVFKNWKIEDFDPPEGATFYQGADWGFSNDPTVLLRTWVDDETRTIYIEQEVYGVGIEIDELPEKFDRIQDSRKWMIRADNARPETISYMKRAGFKIKGVKKGKGSVEEGVEFIKSYNVVIHPRCKRTIDEFNLYSYKTDIKTGDILPILLDKDNHCIDALRYALEDICFNRTQYHFG